MEVPKQVQAMADEAERLELELQASLTSSEPDQEPPVDPQPEPTGEPEAQPSPEPVPEEKPPVQSDDETWKKRFQTLKGKYDAEVPRFSAEVRDLKSQVTQLQAKLEDLTKQTPTPTKVETRVTEKDVEAFGADLIDLIDRKATEVAEARDKASREKLEAELSDLRTQHGSIAEQQSETARRNYFSDLGRLVPDYEEINVDQGFLGWLMDVDALSGATRQEYLNSAFASHDVTRTAALFNAYKREISPAPAPPAAQTPAANHLERQVAPGTSKVAVRAPVGSEERVYSTKEIEAFYTSIRRGEFRGREEEQARIETEIDLAVAQGRLTA